MRAVDGHVRVPDEHQVGLAAGDELLELVLRLVGAETEAVVEPGARVDAEHACPVRQRQAHLQRVRLEPLEPVAGRQHAARPREERGGLHGVADARRRQVAGQDVPVGVPARERRVRQRGERRERLDGLGPERCVVAEHPDHVGAALLLDVREDRVERARVAVDVREGDESQAVAHARPALWSCA